MQRLHITRIFPSALLAAAVLLAVAPQTNAEGWGSVKGRIVFEGEVPKLEPKVKKGDATVRDAQCCAVQEVPNQELVVDPESKGIQHVFVYLRKAPDAIHPDLVEPKEKEVVFDQKNCQFKPHALIVRKGQDVVVKSDDNCAHNTHTNPFRGQPVNFILKPNEREGVKVPIQVVDPLPVKVVCDIHSWMVAWWLTVDHPYAAVTDEQGNFTIENLPEGKHEFTVWQEKAGYLYRPGTSPKFPNLTVTIKDGETVDVGELKVPAAKFE